MVGLSVNPIPSVLYLILTYLFSSYLFIINLEHSVNEFKSLPGPPGMPMPSSTIPIRYDEMPIPPPKMPKGLSNVILQHLSEHYVLYAGLTASLVVGGITYYYFTLPPSSTPPGASSTSPSVPPPTLLPPPPHSHFIGKKIKMGDANTQFKDVIQDLNLNDPLLDLFKGGKKLHPIVDLQDAQDLDLTQKLSSLLGYTFIGHRSQNKLLMYTNIDNKEVPVFYGLVNRIPRLGTQRSFKDPTKCHQATAEEVYDTLATQYALRLKQVMPRTGAYHDQAYTNSLHVLMEVQEAIENKEIDFTLIDEMGHLIDFFVINGNPATGYLIVFGFRCLFPLSYGIFWKFQPNLYFKYVQFRYKFHENNENNKTITNTKCTNENDNRL
jgi:hypothetical protein